MDSPLVDSEGFPLASIDVYAVRHARVKIIQLLNDRSHLESAGLLTSALCSVSALSKRTSHPVKIPVVFRLGVKLRSFLILEKIVAAMEEAHRKARETRELAPATDVGLVHWGWWFFLLCSTVPLFCEPVRVFITKVMVGSGRV